MFKNFLFIGGLLLFICITIPAYAEEELAPGFNACMEKANGVISDSMDCLTQAYEYWDKKLNANFKKVLSEFNSNDESGKQDRKNIIQAQKAWLKYRDSMVEAIFSLNGRGSLAREIANSFLAEETKKQAKWLEGE